MERKSIKFESLDSLRGLAALAVAVFHFSPSWAGYLAVDFFLVLSGFILSHSYLYKNEKVPTAEFISHRIARLYPLHIFTLITFILAYLLIKGSLPQYADGSLFAFIQHLTLTQNVGINPNGSTYNYPSWSISVEFWINVAFILYISRKTKSSTIFFLASIGLILIYGKTGHLDTHFENYFEFLNSGLIRGLSSFLLGILSYRIYLHYKNNKALKNNINYMELISIFSVLIIVLGRPEKLSGIDIAAPFTFMLVIVVFTFEHGIISNYLKKFKYLGEISYSIYLNQITLLLLIHYALDRFNLPSYILLTIYVLLLIIYSHLTYLYIEKPLRKKGRKIISRLIKNPTN